MDIDVASWLGLASAIFAGGFLDAVAGGGGLITLPAFLAAGLPAASALGTNKLVAVTGSFASTLRYARAGLVHRAALPLAALAFAGAVAGASAAVALPERVLKPVLIALLVGALAAVLWQQRSSRGDRGDGRAAFSPWIRAGALGLGFYDGFFGPGMGTFCLALLTTAGGLELTRATGSAKLLNFGSNLGAVLLFWSRGTPHALLGLSLIPVMVAGSWLGASFAVRRGAPVIRALLVVSVLSLCAKLGWDLWRG
jgi:uncharacterized membrane protein YfcA